MHAGACDFFPSSLILFLLHSHVPKVQVSSLELLPHNVNVEEPFHACMQIIHHICECLLDLHTAGYVHRDLKPGNIMWLPSQNRWTLIDFGCAARIDEAVPAGFTLAYAAPEAVTEVYRGEQRLITAHPALDAWSLGVLCLELFTCRPVLVPFEESDVCFRTSVALSPPCLFLCMY